MLKIIKIVKPALLIGWFLGIIYLAVYSFIEGLFLEPYIYWLVLIGLIMFIWHWKKSSRFSLYISFTLFLISAVSVTLGFKNIGEVIMRLSLIFLFVGFFQSMLEYKQSLIPGMEQSLRSNGFENEEKR